MAKQVKVNRPSTANLTTRSPMTNLVFAVILGLLYLTVFDQSPAQSIFYGIGAFLFFNTIDYLILYYRLNKRNK